MIFIVESKSLHFPKQTSISGWESADHENNTIDNCLVLLEEHADFNLEQFYTGKV